MSANGDSEGGDRVNPTYDNGIVQLYQADARFLPLEDESVDCVVTSPPYWGLRDYGIEGQLGLESTPAEYVCHMVEVFREVWRVLRPQGTAWLNLGDSYAGSWGNYAPTGTGGQREKQTERWERPAYADSTTRPPTSNAIPGLKSKDLVGIPWRVAFALQEDGWWLRSDIIWAKPNPMPESVQDRPTRAHEYLFLLSKSERYYYDAAAIKEPPSEASIARWSQNLQGQLGSERANGGAKTNGTMKAVGGPRVDKQRGHGRRHAGFNDRWDGMTKAEQAAMGCNKRSVWEIATHSYAEAHFATFPEALVEPCILAGCPEGGTVLDPFIGSGTTAAVAQRLGRHAVGTDLNPEYLHLSAKRVGAVSLPMVLS